MLSNINEIDTIHEETALIYAAILGDKEIVALLDDELASYSGNIPHGIPITYSEDQLKNIGLFGYTSMMIFLIILTIGFIYEWKKGALEWE